MNELLARLTAMSRADLQVSGTVDLEGADDRSVPVDEDLRMPNGEALQSIGGDSSGGVYFLVGEGGDERPLLYVDSEGGAGLIAADLAEGLELLIGLPNWHDFCARERRAWSAEQVAEWDEIQGTRSADWRTPAMRSAELLGLRLRPRLELIARLDRAAEATTEAWLPVVELHRPTREDRDRHERVQYESIFWG